MTPGQIAVPPGTNLRITTVRQRPGGPATKVSVDALTPQGAQPLMVWCPPNNADCSQPAPAGDASATSDGSEDAGRSVG